MGDIFQANVVDQYKYDMVRYSIETNRRRAFPDYKDGFKIVHRRSLYVMMDLPSRYKFIKSAKAVGDVMGGYHPHGDSSIYESIVNMANWFDTYMPLVEASGNMGSVQGDGAAAMRYTEIKLSKFSLDAIFKDLIQYPEIVDWSPTYDGGSKEPDYLPVAVPLLLINGTYGIGTGRSTSIPPHNINEVIDATLNLIDNPDAPVVLIPDQCMPCEIIEDNWTLMSNSGSGSFIVRAKIDIETIDKGKGSEHLALVVKSVPDYVTIDNGKDSGVLFQINDLIDKGRLPQITQMTEEPTDGDLRWVIHLKKGSDPIYVKNYLYKATELQKKQRLNFEVLDDIELIRMSYKSYLESFIMQRKLTKFRLYCIKLQDARTTLHEKEVCIKVIRSGKIHDIIKKIEKSTLQNEEELIEWLVDLLKITDLQAKFILNYPTKKFAPAYLNKYEAEAEECRAIVDQCMKMIYDENLILEEIKEELKYFKKKYGFPRKSTVITQADVSDIPPGTFNVVITENNYIKKLPVTESIGSYRGDNPAHVITIDNTSDLILITSQGRMYKVPVHKIPVTERNSIGVDIRIMLKGISSNIIGVFDYSMIKRIAKLIPKHYAVICTRGNNIKKLDLQDLMMATTGGVILTKLADGDEVRQVQVMPDNIDIAVYSSRKALRFSMESVPNYKRNALGVYAMNTNEPLDGIVPIDPSITHIVTITNSGKINKIDVAALPVSERYKAGSNVIKLGKNDYIHSMFGAKDSDILHITTKNTKLDISVGDIPAASSVSTGNKMIPLKGDMIVKVNIEY